MQHQRPTLSLPFFSSFKNHRSSIDQSRFRVNLTLPKPIATPVWASLPTPPMSGSPPPNSPAEFPQIAGRRRKRSETPPPTTTATSSAAAISPQTPLEQTAQGSIAQGRGGYVGETPSQPPVYGSAYPPPPPVTYGSGSSLGGTPAGAGESLYSSDQTSPRATRKTKAHVASACINCKKKHLRCDNTRPCRRCTQSGKEDTCVDVEHKKRGRPPLKPDDPSSRRPFESAFSPHSDPSRRTASTDPSSFPSGSGFPRTFRPLQALPPYDPSRPQLRPGQPYGMYAQPSISPSPTMAVGSFITPSRPYSPGQAPSTSQPPSYMPSPVEGSRGMAPYSGGYSYPPPPGQMGPPPLQPYSNPIFPRTTLPPPQSEHLMTISGPSSLQLPPIRPSHGGSPIDPMIAQQQGQQIQHPQEGQASGTGTTRQPSAKRPKMDIQGILGPRTD